MTSIFLLVGMYFDQGAESYRKFEVWMIGNSDTLPRDQGIAFFVTTLKQNSSEWLLKGVLQILISVCSAHQPHGAQHMLSQSHWVVGSFLC